GTKGVGDISPRAAMSAGEPKTPSSTSEISPPRYPLEVGESYCGINLPSISGPQLSSTPSRIPPPFPSTKANSPEFPCPYFCWNLGRTRGSSNVTPALTLTPIPRLFLPDLVVITITPFAALEPYKAEAFAPFNTVIDSTSSGLIKEAPLP